MMQPETLNTRKLAQEREKARRQATQGGIADRHSVARFEALDQEWWRRLGVLPLGRESA
jgi:hypothetical protein